MFYYNTYDVPHHRVEQVQVTRLFCICILFPHRMKLVRSITFCYSLCWTADWQIPCFPVEKAILWLPEKFCLKSRELWTPEPSQHTPPSPTDIQGQRDWVSHCQCILPGNSSAFATIAPGPHPYQEAVPPQWLLKQSPLYSCSRGQLDHTTLWTSPSWVLPRITPVTGNWADHAYRGLSEQYQSNGNSHTLHPALGIFFSLLTLLPLWPQQAHPIL